MTKSLHVGVAKNITVWTLVLAALFVIVNDHRRSEDVRLSSISPRCDRATTIAQAWSCEAKAIEMGGVSASSGTQIGFDVGSVGLITNVKKDAELVLKLNPYDAMALHNKGWAELLLGQRDVGLINISQASDLQPRSAFLRTSFAAALASGGNSADAFKELALGAAESPDVLNSKLAHMIAHGDEQRLDVIARTWNALEADGSPSAIARQAVLADSIGQTETAMRLVSRALKLEPTMPSAWRLRAALDFKIGRPEDAKKNRARAFFMHRPPDGSVQSRHKRELTDRYKIPKSPATTVFPVPLVVAYDSKVLSR